MVFSKGRYSLPIFSCSLFSPISRRGGARLPRRNDWGLSYPVGSRQLRESLSLDAYVRLGTSLIVGVFSLLSPTLLTSSVYKGQQGLSRFDVLVLTLVTAAWVFWDHGLELHQPLPSGAAIYAAPRALVPRGTDRLGSVRKESGL